MCMCVCVCAWTTYHITQARNNIERAQRAQRQRALSCFTGPVRVSSLLVCSSRGVRAGERMAWALFRTAHTRSSSSSSIQQQWQQKILIDNATFTGVGCVLEAWCARTSGVCMLSPATASQCVCACEKAWDGLGSGNDSCSFWEGLPFEMETVMDSTTKSLVQLRWPNVSVSVLHQHTRQYISISQREWPKIAAKIHGNSIQFNGNVEYLILVSATFVIFAPSLSRIVSQDISCFVIVIGYTLNIIKCSSLYCCCVCVCVSYRTQHLPRDTALAGDIVCCRRRCRRRRCRRTTRSHTNEGEFIDFFPLA